MARRISTGIDIGTHQVKVVVAELPSRRERALPRVLGTGLAESRGLHHGFIQSPTEAAKSINAAVRHAEKSAGVSIKRAYVSISGVGLDEIRSTGETVISRGDLEVTDLDLEQAVKASEEAVGRKLVNRRVLHDIPLRITLDGETVLGRPIGLKGNKLAVEMLFVTCLEQHIEDIIHAVEEAGVAVEDVMAAPLAASLVTLTKAQKIAGVVLANIGSETVSFAVFDDGIPVSVKVLPIGSTDITNDIALGLKVPLEEAEKVKLGAVVGASYSQKDLDEIISARLSDIFELIETHLKSIHRNGLLPAGIVLTGGGAAMPRIDEYARDELKLPAKVTLPGFGKHPSVKGHQFGVAYGLALWGFSSEEESMGMRIARETRGGLVSFIRQFLP